MFLNILFMQNVRNSVIALYLNKYNDKFLLCKSFFRIFALFSNIIKGKLRFSKNLTCRKPANAKDKGTSLPYFINNIFFTI